MTNEKWVRRFNCEIATRPSKPGVWRRKEGGFLIRGRATDPRTERMREVKRVLADETSATSAYQLLQTELQSIRDGLCAAAPTRRRFNDWSVSLLERKMVTGEIKSASTRVVWGSILRRHLLPAFGGLFVDQLRRPLIEEWKSKVGRRIQTGELSPHTANHWLRVLRVIMATATDELELDRNPMAGIKNFDTSEHVFTEEDPNALTPDELPLFLAKLRSLFPQHFAMVALGFSTGLRPSSLRPLRRAGKTPDILWDEGALLVRRSQTRGDEVMNTTKTRRRQRIALPEEMMEILRWHVDNLPPGPMRDSDLLFPSLTGGFRAPSCLHEPFRTTAEALGITKRVTPKAMRRTFQDLARAAEVKDIVTRAVSGHATERMQQHYSTVRADEVRAGLARVISLAGVRAALDPRGSGASGGALSGASRPKPEMAG